MDYIYYRYFIFIGCIIYIDIIDGDVVVFMFVCFGVVIIRVVCIWVVSVSVIFKYYL